MCGIVGYTGNRKATSILLEGLKRLEYRGYDSAGLALTQGDRLEVIKTVGRVDTLAKETGRHRLSSSTGISHTRWATHGAVTEANAHPHLSNDGRFALVHNGVIENQATIRDFLLGQGSRFHSQTDTEVLVEWIAYHYRREPAGEDPAPQRIGRAIRRALREIEGTFGLAILCIDAPDEIVAARRGSPLVLGLGEGEHLLASDVSAFVSRTQNVVYLNDDEVVRITPQRFSIATLDEEDVPPVIDRVTWSAEAAERGSHRHFMEKEIFEQPAALENTMRGRFSADGSTANFGGLGLTAHEFRQIDRFAFCACGSAWHASLVAKHLIERFARLPVDVDYASEFRYRHAPLTPRTLVWVVSQSGETIDTLGALREAKRKGHKVLAINNSVGSTIAREADGGIYQHIGPEIGVASTKAFTSQLLVAALIALYTARQRDMSFQDGVAYVDALKRLPALVRQTLDQAPRIQEIARRYAQERQMLFLGRLALFPIALEGALKLKEISYIHAQGYPAAEMKHGPIALIGPDCPSVIFAPQNELFPKVVSSIQEIKARGGRTLVVLTEGATLPAGLADEIIPIPACHEAILPIVATIPVQLLSYYIACERGCDVDKPRNLAKAVTVE